MQDNYAPVVVWSTVWIFLVVYLILGRTTVSIDLINAFVQSILNTTLLCGYVTQTSYGYFLLLNRSLNGLRRSPILWSQTGLDECKTIRFKESAFHPCLLYCPGMMVIPYEDDCGNPKDIDELFADLFDLGFELTREGDFTG